MSPFPISKPLILCIFGDEAILHYEKELLEKSGYAVLTAASAKEGLRLVKMCKCDAVILDYEMPRIDGHEVASEIKRVRPDLMVILLSGGDVSTHAIVLADASVRKTEASQRSIPLIVELSGLD